MSWIKFLSRFAILFVVIVATAPSHFILYSDVADKDFEKFQTLLSNYHSFDAREHLDYMLISKITPKEWIKIRDIVHANPQIGIDVLQKIDDLTPFKKNKVDQAISVADKYFELRKFKEAAILYQKILKFIIKNKKYDSKRNDQLYWSLIHSLARSFYGLKQYNEALTVYKTIPISYPFYRQVLFESMWASYMNDDLEFALGAIASMNSGNFSKVLEPEVYLVQYYIYKRLCNDEAALLVKNRVQAISKLVLGIEFQLGTWIRKDVDKLVYRKILLSGDLKNKNIQDLRSRLEMEKNRDFDRLEKEFELVNAHFDLDSGKNSNLSPMKKFKNIGQILNTKNDFFLVSDKELWTDEIGKYVYLKKDLCQ